MRNLIKLIIFLGILCLGLGVAYLILNFMFLDFFVDQWWFDSLGYKNYFYLRIIYRYISFIGVTAIFFFIFFFNFLIASRYLGKTLSDNAEDSSDTNKRRISDMFQSGSMKVYTPLSLFLAIPIAIPFYEHWEKGLLYIFGKSSGIKDALFGLDISFYLFSFPIYKLIQTELLITFTLLFTGIIFLYWLENRLLRGKNEKLPKGAKGHLAILILVLTAILTWGFVLQGFDLLYINRHKYFFGPGNAEIKVILPFIALTAIFMIFTSLSLISYLRKRKGLIKLSIFFILMLMFLLGYKLPHVVNIYEYLFIKANKGVEEEKYIKANINATLDAYNLKNIETKEFSVKQKPQVISNETVRNSLRNIPVWDRQLLDDVYIQEQGIRSYYTFYDVDVDRYNVQHNYQQVYLAAREIVPDATQNWQNRHLHYTHGNSLVMTPAAQGGDELMTWFVRDMPSSSEYGIEIEQPGVYYGLGKYDYAIAPNKIGEMHYPNAESNVKIDYDGTGGIPLNSFLRIRRLLFWNYFGDSDIFLTDQVNKNSRILLRRNIVDAINMITPFFLLDSDPYIVSTDKGLFWIQDAFTTSRSYPIAQPYNPQFNYIRNSVKIIVNAYNGNIDYYIADKDDPIIQAYNRIYPGLLKPLADMPPELKAHLRYPKDLFEVQLSMYGEYHQTDPATFFGHEDIWEMPILSSVNQSIPIRPYYLTLNLNQGSPEFLLLSPMSSRDRNNLRALAVAGCDGNNYGKIFVYRFPEGQLIYGPSQINSLIDQDTEIAQQLTLWDQAGSEVKRGRMIILPIDNFVLYIQPVYLSSATHLKIPELKRLIVTQGDVYVMAPSLEEAFKMLDEKLRVRIERQKNRFPVEPPPSDTPEKQSVPTAEKPETQAEQPEPAETREPQHNTPVMAQPEQAFSSSAAIIEAKDVADDKTEPASETEQIKNTPESSEQVDHNTQSEMDAPAKNDSATQPENQETSGDI